MGKKSRKKKTGKNSVPSSSSSPASSPVVAVAVAVAVAAVAARDGGGGGRDGYVDTILPDGAARIELPSSCFHGSNLTDFKNLDYKGAIQAYTLLCSDINKCEQDNPFIATLRLKMFYDDHEHLMKHDNGFPRFVFAYCTHLYQTQYHVSAKYKMKVERLLRWGIRMRYQDQVDKGVSTSPGSENYEKYNKYNRDIHAERGIIKCLARETPCTCMDSKKVEAQGMDKTNQCHGCLNLYSKTSLFFCTGCHFSQYCSKACQVTAWPNHRDLCKSHQMKSNSIDK